MENAMTSEEEFASSLAAHFVSRGYSRRLEELSRPSFVLGDGKPVCLGDRVEIPSATAGRRLDRWAEVVQLSEDGIGVRFSEKAFGIAREFFEWPEVLGAAVIAGPGGRKRKFIVPPRAAERR